MAHWLRKTVFIAAIMGITCKPVESAASLRSQDIYDFLKTASLIIAGWHAKSFFSLTAAPRENTINMMFTAAKDGVIHIAGLWVITGFFCLMSAITLDAQLQSIQYSVTNLVQYKFLTVQYQTKDELLSAYAYNWADYGAEAYVLLLARQWCLQHIPFIKSLIIQLDKLYDQAWDDVSFQVQCNTMKITLYTMLANIMHNMERIEYLISVASIHTEETINMQ